MKCLGETTLQWFWVISWVGLLLWTYLTAIHIRKELRQTKDAAREASEAKKEIARTRDAYRTPAQPLSEQSEIRRVYCVDCRFKSISVQGGTICLAMPIKGSYRTIGQTETNANHDCVHYQAKEKS